MKLKYNNFTFLQDVEQLKEGSTLDRLTKEIKRKIYWFLNQKLNLLKNILIEPPKQQPIYGLGKADPICTRSYNSFSGIDMKIIFTDEDGEHKLGTVQGISFKIKTSPTLSCFKGEGDMIVVIFDNDNIDVLGKEGLLVAAGAIEGSDELYYYFNERVIFDSVSSGCAIDDIIIEKCYHFNILS